MTRTCIMMTLVLLIGAFATSPASAGESLAELKAKIDKIAEGFHGVLGYSMHFRGKPEQRISLRGDEAFPTASTIKTAVMCEVMHQIEKGKIKWSDEVEVQKTEDERQAGGFSYYFKEGTKISIDQWTHLMMTVSDNTATMLLREHLGQKNINDWLESQGFKETRILNGKKCDELGLRPLQQVYGLGKTTPNEMLRLIETIRDGKAGSAASCDRMQRIMNHQYWDDAIQSQVPPHIHVGSKGGAVNRSRSDAAIFTTPMGEVALTIYTKDQEDQRWVDDNEGDVAVRSIAALVWRHYDPKHTWSPPEGAEKLWPGAK